MPNLSERDDDAAALYVRELIGGIESIVAGAAPAEGRRIVRSVKTWAERAESALIRGEPAPHEGAPE